MDNYTTSGAYAGTPCVGCGPGSMPVSPAMPNQAEAPSYSYTNPLQKQLPQSTGLVTTGLQTLGSAQPIGVPSLQEIASYNLMTPAQRQRQQQQLAQLGGTMIPGTPGFLSGRSQAATEMMAQQTTPASLAPITPTTQPAPISGESLQYLNGFLRTQIGRAVKIDFLIGTNTLVDRTGILLGVGANFVLINETETDDLVACDFYNIKFIKFYY